MKKKFKISGYNYVNQFLCTWKCAFYRKKNKFNKDKEDIIIKKNL